SGTVCACLSEPRIFQTTAPERYDPFVDYAQRHLPTSTVRSGGTRRLYRRCGPLHMDHDALMPTDDYSQCDRTLRHGHPRNYAYAGQAEAAREHACRTAKLDDLWRSLASNVRLAPE